MISIFGLLCICAGGVLAVQARRGSSAQKKIEMVSGLLLAAGLSLIGWGLNVRL